MLTITVKNVSSAAAILKIYIKHQNCKKQKRDRAISIAEEHCASTQRHIQMILWCGYV
jgi:hypothetical protein